jgi:hypothetical protein
MHIMSKVAAKRLPEQIPYHHAIDPEPGKIPLWGPCYALFEKELDVLREWVKEMLDTCKIRRSKSPAAVPILFIPKAHGRRLRLWVDYDRINKIPIAKRYPLPIMSELQDRVSDSKIFTKIHLKNGYHLICIKEDDEWKTAVQYRYGLYQFLVMPFGVTNASAAFHNMINHILKDLLDKGVVVYIDEILIYPNNEEIHDELVKEVLERLAKNDLVISREKCVCGEKEVEFLTYILTPPRMRIAKDNTKAIQE